MGVYELSSSKGCLAETSKRKDKENGHLSSVSTRLEPLPRRADLPGQRDCARARVAGAPRRAAVHADAAERSPTVSFQTVADR